MGNIQGPEHAIGCVVQVLDRKYRIERQLGEGGFAYVFKVIEEGSQKAFALKRVLAASNDAIRIAEQEIDVMKQCASKNIIEYIGHSKVSGPKRDGHRSPVEYFILMEYCPGGTLTDYLDRRKGNPIPEREMLGMALDVALGVQALHNRSEPICHRDLKLDNVLLSKDKLWKICDFGSSTTRAKAYTIKEEICNEEEIIQQYTTPSYRSPEMSNLWLRLVVGTKADIWALGCIIYTIAFLKHPFANGPGSATNVVYKSSGYSEYFVTFLKEIFNDNPDKRPDINHVIDSLKCLQRGEVPKKPKGKKAPKPATKAKKGKKSAPAAEIEPPSGSSSSASEESSESESESESEESSSPSPPQKASKKKAHKEVKKEDVKKKKGKKGKAVKTKDAASSPSAPVSSWIDFNSFASPAPAAKQPQSSATPDLLSSLFISAPVQSPPFASQPPPQSFQYGSQPAPLSFPFDQQPFVQQPSFQPSPQALSFGQPQQYASQPPHQAFPFAQPQGQPNQGQYGFQPAQQQPQQQAFPFPASPQQQQQKQPLSNPFDFDPVAPSQSKAPQNDPWMQF